MLKVLTANCRQFQMPKKPIKEYGVNSTQLTDMQLHIAIGGTHLCHFNE